MLFLIPPDIDWCCIFVTVVPNAVRVLDEKGRSISNGTRLDPSDEGTEITLRCEALNGRPTPKVSWYKEGEKLTGKLVVFAPKYLLLYKIKLPLKINFTNRATSIFIYSSRDNVCRKI